jgi:OFA family oxalate/formate antiporter-like MFS transporter
VSTAVEASQRPHALGFALKRWSQLLLGIACMIAIANVQYGWTLFINPINEKFGWGIAALQWTFAIVIAVETFIAMPFGGALMDRTGPKWAALAGPLIALGWYINSVADQLYLFYGAAVIIGCGTGLTFAAVYGNAARWFPDKRGLALGATAFGFAFGGVLTVVPLGAAIKASGYAVAYQWFGLGQGLVVLVAGLLLRAPRAGEVAVAIPMRLTQGAHDRDWRAMLRSRPFWLMYAMFTLVGAGGLMLQAQVTPMARDLAIAYDPVTILGITMLAPIFAVSLLQVTNGFSRPAFGWLSDHIGRERAMFIAFSLEALTFVALVFLARDPVWFVLLIGLAFLFWGEIFSLFPAICADTYGARHQNLNYGLLYTAKGTASLLVPLASLLQGATGSWTTVLIVVAAFNAVAALVALLLPAARRRFIAGQG